MVIVGSGILQRPDADAIHGAACSIANNVARPQGQGWRTLNILHRVNGGGGGGGTRGGRSRRKEEGGKRRGEKCRMITFKV